ncbi:Mucin-19-like 3 [Homarus americanus]|uniref:Mucin-19-like 3 n=1 Tax=Homarus americanus TaxID=6706 RepID=A0A8J5NB41_HOMAM|nr:Mucin-19-like 3 [Homarus americanus]
MTCLCTYSGIVKSKKDCPSPGPRPNAGCEIVVEDCCQTWDCGKDCKDQNGVHHNVGDTWVDPRDPCMTCLCTYSGIVKSKKDCPSPGPRPNAGCKIVVEDCCQKWDCGKDCKDQNGVHHNVGDTWVDPRDPCMTCLCTYSGIVKSKKDCPSPGPRPNAGCEIVIEDCCQKWDCGKDCKDQNGVHHNVGDTWVDPRDPCMTCLCTYSGIVKSKKDCPSPGPRPNAGCEIVIEDCCQKWDCGKNSTCPDPNSFERYCKQYYDQCQSDLDCKSGMQCCLVAGCGKECMSGNGERCPDTTGIVTPCVVTEEDCSTDEDCEGILRCCPYGCSKRCLVPGSECPAHCPPIHKPVCGSDGKVYSSECDLKQRSCRTPYLKKVKDEYC